MSVSVNLYATWPGVVPEGVDEEINKIVKDLVLLNAGLKLFRANGAEPSPAQKRALLAKHPDAAALVDRETLAVPYLDRTCVVRVAGDTAAVSCDIEGSVDWTPLARWFKERGAKVVWGLAGEADFDEEDETEPEIYDYDPNPPADGFLEDPEDDA